MQIKMTMTILSAMILSINLALSRFHIYLLPICQTTVE